MTVYYDPYDVGNVHDPYDVKCPRCVTRHRCITTRVPVLGAVPAPDVKRALSNWETFSNSRSDILELNQSTSTCPPGEEFEAPRCTHASAG
jgi:hypothetical protein